MSDSRGDLDEGSNIEIQVTGMIHRHWGAGTQFLMGRNRIGRERRFLADAWSVLVAGGW